MGVKASSPAVLDIGFARLFIRVCLLRAVPTEAERIQWEIAEKSRFLRLGHLRPSRLQDLSMRLA